MSMIGQLDFFSLIAAFCVFFVALPALLTTSSRDGSWIFRAAAGFVLVSLFFRVTIMFCGFMGANLPGIIVALFVIWLCGALIWSRGGWSDSAPRFGHGFLGLLRALENGAELGQGLSFRRASRLCALFCLLVTVTLIHRGWYGMHNLRFARIATYSLTLDLEKFAHRDTPVTDGAAYILEPLHILSGLHPDSVVRFSGPLFSTLLVLAGAFCAFRFLKSFEAAVIAGALIAAWPALAGVAQSGEQSGAEFAAVYWLLGAGFLGRSWRMAVYAFSTALLVSWTIAPIVLMAAAAVGLAYLLTTLARRIPEHFRSIPAGSLAAIALLLLVRDCNQSPVDGPFEYEAAARASRAIAAQFRANEWLIVSPVHELAFTYGRGWHLELLDFVSAHTADQTAHPEFSFPYNVKDIFVFVEKQPLASWRQGGQDFASGDLTQTMDRAIFAYQTGIGRASIEYRAGALLSAYSANHSDVSIFTEDERFVVFHLKGQPDKPAAVRAAAKYGG